VKNEVELAVAQVMRKSPMEMLLVMEYHYRLTNDDQWADSEVLFEVDLMVDV
jgi:hypothetical protein